MNRTVCFLLLCALSTTTVFARLGDTLDQAEARYGLEKQSKTPTVAPTLLSGARHATFEFQGWRIRCGLLQATDENFYVVREEYTKIWNSNVMKAGGVIQIRDFERDAVFQAEGGNWSFKTLAESGPDVISTASNQLARSLGFTKVWVRSDGAMAHINIGEVSVILDLPQALKYEAEMKGIKDQQQREKAKQLVNSKP